MAIFYPDCRINLSVVFDGFGGPDTPVVISDILPYSANVHVNSYKQADTWEVTFDAKRFPFSPELIRSAAVEVYLFDKKSMTNPLHWHDLPGSVRADPILLPAQYTSDNLLVTGLVDQATLTEDDDGGKVSFTGRDYTALLIDRQWDPTASGHGGRVPDGDLPDVVQKLVDEATNKDISGRTLTVKFFDDESDAPSVHSVSKSVTSKTVHIPKTTTSRSRKPRGISVKPDSTYWDVIYKLCLNYGFIVFVKGFEVWITKPHVLQALAGTNFRVAHGRNLKSLEVERKMSKEAVPQIRITSWDSKLKRTIEGRFPLDGDIENQKKGKDKKGKGGGFLTGVGTRREEFKTFSVPDVNSVTQLVQIARSTYYTLARGEGIVRFETPFLQDLDSKDLLRMKSGDSVQITWDAFNSEVMANPSVTRQQKIATLLALGYSTEVAALVADQYVRLDYFRQPFYVKDVNYTWDKQSGCKISCEAMNFINPDSPRFKIR